MSLPATLTLAVATSTGKETQQAARLITRLLNHNGWYAEASTVLSDAEGEAVIPHAVITASTRFQASCARQADLLVIAAQIASDQFPQLLAPHGELITDRDQAQALPPSLADRQYQVPLMHIAREIGHQDNARSDGPAASAWAILGAVVGWLGWDKLVLQGLLDGPRQRSAVDKQRLTIALAAYNEVVSQRKTTSSYPHRSHPTGYTLSGWEALLAGARAAGVGMVALSAGTASDTTLSTAGRSSGDHTALAPFVYGQSAQQAAAWCLGAALAGARTVLLTAGRELYEVASTCHFAATTETPLVLAHIAGAASQHPEAALTQDQLTIALQAAGPDLPALVAAPATAEECLLVIQEVSNLAEYYQTPALLLLDHQLLSDIQLIRLPHVVQLPIERGQLLSDKQAAAQAEYHRYTLTGTGISPRKTFGQPGHGYTVTDRPHDTDGQPTTDAAAQRAQTSKRLRKLDRLPRHSLPFKLHGPADADITLVGYGSLVRLAQQAMAELEKDGLSVNVLQIVYLAPFPVDKVREVLRTSPHILLLDGSATGQLARLIHQQTGIAVHHQLTAADSIPLTAAGITRKVKRAFTHGR